MGPQTDHASPLANDELVVLQLLEEIHQLTLPSASGVPPSKLRLQAAAKLYLDTRDTFEVIERNVEGQSDRPKFLRKLSKRRGLSVTPRDSLVMPSDAGVAAGGGGSVPSSARRQVEADFSAGVLSARSDAGPAASSRRSSVSSQAGDLGQISEAIIDRVQDMFRHLGEQLGRAILDELGSRNLSIQSSLHYVRFLPADAQWIAYIEKRNDEVRQAYNPHKLTNETLLQQLKRNAEFIKEQIRKDVNTVCLFAPDGTLSTIFGDDINTDNEAVAEKFEVLVRDVYAKYLFSIIDTKMEQLLHVSDQWQQDMAVMGASPVTADAPHAQLYVRARKFRSKIPIFPHAITAIDDRASSAVLPPGHQARILVADLTLLGVWWQKSILAATDRDVTTIHTDESRGIAGVNASLDGQIYVPLQFENSSDFVRRYARHGGLAKWQGQRLLVNNGKDSLWVETTVLEVEDKRVKLQLKRSIEHAPETTAWQQLLAANEWVPVRDLKLCIVPLNSSFRIHMGLKLRTMVDVFQSLIVEVGSIFPNEHLEQRVGKSLWQAVEPSLSRGEHIFARYFRSVLNQELQPRHVAAPAHALERSSSIVMASASVRNLVAALEHSALTHGHSGGSVSGPPSGASTPMPTLQRRLSLSSASSANTLGRAVEDAFFDEKGVYHYQMLLPDTPLRVNAVSHRVSPFEKLAHHLLEENEMIGACVQNNNIALGRAFAQVLQEKLLRLTKQLQTRLETADEASSLEAVVAEYANACRFLYTWHIVRHEMDTTARQRRDKRDTTNVIHAEWVDRSFLRMEALVVAMLRLQLQYVQRVFFHECARHMLPSISAQDWGASKPWFSHARCTYAVQFTVFRVHTLFEGVVRLLTQYERVLCVHEKMHEMGAWLVVDLVACVAGVYESLDVSRARATQWKMDVLYFVVGVHGLLQLLDKMLAPKTAHAQQNGRGRKKPTTEIREMCLRLLACLAIRCGPARVVADEVWASAELHAVMEHRVDAITELEVHLTAIRSSLGIHHEASSTLVLDGVEQTSWTSHNVFGDLELKFLADVELNWAALISRSNLGPEAMLASLQRRHELGEWEYPPLTEDQVTARGQLRECVDRLEARLSLSRLAETPLDGRSTSQSRTTTPDPRDPSTAGARGSQGSSRSLHGPAVNGPTQQTPSLPNNPSDEPSDAPSSPAAARPASASLASSPSSGDVGHLIGAGSPTTPPDSVG